MSKVFLFVLGFAPLAWGQPVIFLRGVVNAASFAPAASTAGDLSRGGIFSIFGKDLGPAAPAQVSAFPLETTFQGVSIRVTQGSRSVQAIPIFVSASQINAILPSDAPLGLAALRVSYNGREGGAATVRIADNALGIFTATGAGTGPAIVQNFISSSEQPINSMVNTARQRQVVILWATGVSPIQAPDNQAPPVGDFPVAVEILVGGKRVTNRLYSGRSPCCSGVDQLVFEVPADAPSGCHVPVMVKAGARWSNVVTMAIEPEGKPCSDPLNPFSAPFRDGKRVGVVELTRANLYFDTHVFQINRFAIETLSGYFRQERGGAFAFEPNFSLPPEGTCTAYTTSGFVMGGGVRMPLANPARGLDAGSLTLTSGSGSAAAPPVKIGAGSYYNPALASTVVRIAAGAAEPAGFFAPGAFTLTGTGGADIGAINASLTLDPAVSWTNRDSFTNVNRTQGIRYQWSGAAKARVIVGGTSYDMPSNATTVFYCVAPGGVSAFDVPPEMLAQVTPARPLRQHSIQNLFLASVPSGAPLPVTASGLDFAAVVHKSITWKSVRFR